MGRPYIDLFKPCVFPYLFNSYSSYSDITSYVNYLIIFAIYIY